MSPASTGTVLSDKSRYDFFARTVPPDNYQVEVLADIVQKFNWTYVSLISSEGQYGDSGSTAFQREAKARNICIPIIEEVPHHADDAKFDEIFRNLHDNKNAKGVILFLREEDARGILAAAKRSNKTHDFVFLAPDAWGRQQKLVEGLEDVAEGAITVELTSQDIDEFNEYMMNLTPRTNKRNPWFREYWEKLFQCKVEDDSHRGYNNGHVYNVTEVPCSQHLRLDVSVGYTQEPKVQFVVDAVYAFAHALDSLMRDLCDGIDFANCTAMHFFDGGDFYQKYLLNISFIGKSLLSLPFFNFTLKFNLFLISTNEFKFGLNSHRGNFLVLFNLVYLFTSIKQDKSQLHETKQSNSNKTNIQGVPKKKELTF